MIPAGIPTIPGQIARILAMFLGSHILMNSQLWRLPPLGAEAAASIIF